MAAGIAEMNSGVRFSAPGPEAIAGDEVDLIVVGSGAAGLAAAVTARLIGLRVLLLEGSELIGGSTALSGGVVWIPNNPLRSAMPSADNEADVLAYVKRESGDHFDRESVAAFSHTAPNMVRFMADHAGIEFCGPQLWPDYHQEYPGAREGGRSMRVEDFDGRLLGLYFSKLRPPLRSMTMFGGMMVGAKDYQHLMNAKRSPVSLLHLAGIALRHVKDRIRYSRGTRLTNGNAMVARLLYTYLRLEGSIWTSAPLVALDKPDTQVVGVTVKRDGNIVRVGCRLGVILATGGFPANAEMRKKIEPRDLGVQFSQTLAPNENRGAGIMAALEVGADINRNMLDPAAWVPVSCIQWGPGETGWFPHFFDRSKPGFIMVDGSGRRFANEASSYHDIGRAMRALDANRRNNVHIIADHRALSRYGVGVVGPFSLLISFWRRNGYLKCAHSIGGLAATIGMDPECLEETVGRYNADASQGRDLEFNKGESAYARYIGDPSAPMNPSVAALTQAPFYAVRVILGDLGTFEGLRADPDGRVLCADGAPIAGLFAVGNDRASVFGGTYPAAGITLGPALTFGYRAALAATGIDHETAAIRASGRLERTAMKLE